MNHIKISIIVPCYNVEQYIDQCVESIQKQTYPFWELILVDDGSKDTTPKICDKYAEEDQRIIVVHKPNGGLVSARNAGYKVATGDWFFFLDGDDWVDIDMLEKCVKQISEHPQIEVIFWKIVQELEEKQVFDKWYWPCKTYTEIYEGKKCHELAKRTLEYKYGIASPVIRLINMDYAKNRGIQHDDRTVQGCEGLIFAIRSFYYAKQVLFINEFFYHYRYNPASISKSVNEKNTLYEIECFKVIEEDISKFEEKDEFYNLLLYKSAYVILAMAMNTYFHPLNKESLRSRCRKFGDVINGYNLFSDAVQSVELKNIDKQRKLAFWFVKHKLYFMLDIIGKAKQLMLKRGKYNY